MAWVGLAEEKPEKIVRPVAYAGLEPNFLQALKITWSNDLRNRSPTSRSIQDQRPYVARRIPRDDRVAGSNEEAELHGFTATCALPLQFGSHGAGALTIHSAEPDAFGAEEVSLLRELANDLAAGIIGLRERAKRRLAENRLAAVVDATDDGIVGHDVHGVISEWNMGATRLFGFSREEALGRRFEDFLVPTDLRSEELRVQSARALGEAIPTYETLRLCKNGDLVRALVTVRPIVGATGDVIGSTTVLHDVTQARMAQEATRARKLQEAEVARLTEIDRARKAFMNRASHELNTPLTPLRIHVEALGEDKELAPSQREHLRVIERNVLRLAGLVRGMLEASGLDAGPFPLELAPLSLGASVRDALRNLSPAAVRAGISLTRVPSLRVMVNADRDRIAQVLHNLVSNAIAFTPRGGAITLALSEEGGRAVVRVTDTGIGLSAEQIAELFRPFARPQEAEAGLPKGAGLGLFISKALIEQQGGRIWAESAGTSQGSTFAFDLPLQDPQAGTKEPAVTPPRVAPEGPKVAMTPNGASGPSVM